MRLCVPPRADQSRVQLWEFHLSVVDRNEEFVQKPCNFLIIVYVFSFDRHVQSCDFLRGQIVRSVSHIPWESRNKLQSELSPSCSVTHGVMCMVWGGNASVRPGLWDRCFPHDMGWDLPSSYIQPQHFPLLPATPLLLPTPEYKFVHKTFLVLVPVNFSNTGLTRIHTY